MSAQKRRPGGFFGALLGFVAFSALAGLLVSVMVVPSLAVTSVTASSAANIFNSLPDDIEISEQPQQNQIFAENGKNDDGSIKYTQIATVYGNQNREELSWDEVPDMVKNVVLAAEDKRFYEHGGVDPQGLVRAVVKNAATGSSEGASTLSQQLVKNLCVVAALTKYSTPEEDPQFKAAAAVCKEVSLDRKIREMKNAIALEKKYSKDEILLAYLNIANFGGTVYGIQTASQRFFDVDAKDLTLAQAASLIAIVQEPEKRRLDYPENYAANQERRDHILREMLDEKLVTQEEYDAAIATPVNADTVDVQPAANGCLAAKSTAKQFCDYVVHSVKDLPALGNNEEERLAAWKLGGFKLYTTLDLKLQKVAQKAVRTYAPNDETAFRLGAATTAVEPGTGYIRTMAQNKVFDNRSEEEGGGGIKTSAINFNTTRDYGGSGGFQPGSTYKAFTLLNWLEAGHGLEEKVNVTRTSTPMSEFTDSCNGPHTGTYSPRNDAGETGYKTIRQATRQSINGGFVQMILQLDLCRTKEIALDFGIRLASPRLDDPATPEIDETQEDTDLTTSPASILGVDDIAPLNIAAAFAGIVNNGQYCKPVAVTRIVNADDEELPGQSADCTQAIDPEVAAAAIDGLSGGPLDYAANPNDGTPFIGKTGTTDNSKHTWVTLASTALASTVWVGNISGKYPLRSYAAAGVSGGQLRHEILRTVMASADQRYVGKALPKASARLQRGISSTVGNYVGMDEGSAKSAIEQAKLRFANGGQVASAEPAGTVARQTPEAGTSLSQGQKVTIWISDGSKAKVPNVVGQDIGAARGAINGAGYGNIAETCVPTATGGGVDPATGQPRAKEGQVIAVTPSAGTVLKLNKTVTVDVARSRC
jgi:membrane peptidoglycan carboxypeptidase